MTAKSAALVIGLVFIAVGILGFIDNPIIGEAPNAMFYTDNMHNWVHIGSGILFVLVGLAAPGFAATFLMLFGIVYLLLGVVGFVTVGAEGMGKVLGILNINGKDNFLHVGLGLAIFIAGVAARKTPAAPRY